MLNLKKQTTRSTQVVQYATFHKHPNKQQLLTWVRFFLTPLYIPESLFSDNNRCMQGNNQCQPYGGNLIFLKLITCHLSAWIPLHINSMKLISSHLPFNTETRIIKYRCQVVSVSYVTTTHHILTP